MIIERYIRQEILQKFAGILALLMLIFISKYYVSYLADAAAGEIAGSAVFQLLALKMMSVLTRILPVAFLLSVLMAFSRLQRDRELVIMSACGLKHRFYPATVLKFTLIFFIPYAFMVLFSNPWVEHRIDVVKEEAKKESDITGLGAGQFKEFSKGDRVVYLERMAADGKSMEQVFVQVRQNDRLGVMTSGKARFKWHSEFEERYVVFNNGKRYVGDPGSLDYQITDYETYALMIGHSASIGVHRQIESMSTLNLFLIGNAPHWAELQARLSSLILFLYLPLLAVVLCTISYDDKQYQLILICMLIYFFYSNVINVCTNLVEKSKLTPWIGVWWMHILMISLLVMIYQWSTIRKYFSNEDNQQLLLAS